MKAWTAQPARAKGLQPGARRRGEGCGIAHWATNPLPRGNQAEEPSPTRGPVANAMAARNAAGRLPGGEPCEGEPHARFWKGVLETERGPWRRIEPLCGKPQESAAGPTDSGHRASALLHPSAPLWSEQGRSYKPMAKSSGAQRESEGVVVPLMGVQQNAPGGKGPCFGRASAEGTGQGMIRPTGSNHPAGRSSGEQVRRLERTLSVAAKRPSRHFRGVSNVIRSGDPLRGTRWPFVAWSRMPHGKTIVKPDAGKSHVRFERGSVETGRIAVPRH